MQHRATRDILLVTCNEVSHTGLFDLTHKTIPLDVSDSISDEARELIDRFNREFDSDDLYIEIDGGSIALKLQKADVRRVRTIVAQLTSDASIDGHGIYLHAALAAVESVRSYGLLGGKRNYVDYNRERKVKDRLAKEQRRGRHYYAKDREFEKARNTAPHEYTDRVVCGDSAEVLSRLPDNCVDLIFTSPPYNFGLDYSDGRDDQRWDDYFEKLFQVFDECIRVLKFGGRIAVNVQPLFSDYIPSHHIISNFFMERRLIWKGEILWEKNNYNCKYTAWGSWKSPSSPYLKYTWEFIEVFCKGSLKADGDRSDADIDAEEFKQWVNAKWSIAPERNMREYGHPAMFPEELATRVLKLFSFQGDLVLDPFAGVGTVPVVAKKTGRRFLGIDISPDYCATSERRLRELLL